MTKFTILIAAVLTVGVALGTATPVNAGNKEDLRRALGDFPTPVALETEELERVQIEGGERILLQYVVEEADPRFGRPVDKVKAYLFVPHHKKGEKLPAVIAIHQDGPSTHLGKSEPAGIAGAEDQHYGLELFQSGYVVICPDRYYHAERRRIPNAATAPSVQMRDLGLWLKWVCQLIVTGRTHFGKEAYDLSRAADVVSGYSFVDADRIGAIGHSAGGNVLIYFMFTDPRIKVGVSSCGFYELLDDFNEHDRSFSNPAFAIPGLANIGRSADYLAFLAPRPVLLTRGLHETEDEEASRAHADSTRRIEAFVWPFYQQFDAGNDFRVRYFEGGHAFPEEIRRAAYKWLDRHLKREAQAQPNGPANESQPIRSEANSKSSAAGSRR
jgi:dienelactone hydrolase